MQTLFSRWNRWMRLWARIVTLGAWSLCYAASATDYYVSTNGSDGAAGTNWATALLTISQAVVRATTDGDMVLLSNGVHNIAATNITITNGITLQGVWGRSNTVVQRSEAALYRLFILSNANAVLTGLELRNGFSGSGAKGGAVWMSGGTISNCNLVSNNTSGSLGSEYGGAVYMTGGTVRDCNVVNNFNGGNYGGGLALEGSCLVSNCFITANMGTHGGGGIFINSAGALVTHCVINNNTNRQYTGGGGILIFAGTAQNCLIVNNRQTFSGASYGGGGVQQYGGALLNCTVAGNAVLSDNTAGGVWWVGGSITNTIIYGNTRGGAAENLIASALTTIGYSCAPELIQGTNGNITGDPDYLDLSQGNYRLAPGSPAIDSGTNTGLTTDLDGAARPQDGNGIGGPQWDMGAYEAQASTSGVLRCSFIGSPVTGMAPLTVVFQASVAGTNTIGLEYRWDVNADGTNDYTGAGFISLTNVYSPGIYNVALSVSNSAAETNQRLKNSYLTAWAPELYVAINGAHTTPFTNWVMAATNLASALTLAGNGTTITLTNGTYDCIGLTLSYATVLQSVNGSAATTLRNPPASTARLLDISHAQAVVTGFTLTGGNLQSQAGGAVYMSAGTIRDCNLVTNRTAGDGHGGTVYMTGGTLRDCNVTANWGANYGGGLALAGSCLVSNCFITANMGTHGGGGIYMISAGALVTHCVINNNTNFYHTGGGGIYMTAGTVQNCLIAKNRTTYIGETAFGYGGGVRQGGGTVLNCTIVSNQTSTNWHLGGGIYKSAGAVTNCIVWDNWRATDRDDLTNTVDVGYSDALELTNGVNGNISADPQFVYPATNNYRLREGSPCVDAGVNMPWMVGATDLDGRGRIWFGGVDMGAYELPPAKGTVFTIH